MATSPPSQIMSRESTIAEAEFFGWQQWKDLWVKHFGVFGELSGAERSTAVFGQFKVVEQNGLYGLMMVILHDENDDPAREK